MHASSLKGHLLWYAKGKAVHRSVQQLRSRAVPLNKGDGIFSTAGLQPHIQAVPAPQSLFGISFGCVC